MDVRSTEPDVESPEVSETAMFRSEPNPDRSLLRFEEAVLAAFSFLVAEFQFRVVETAVTRVRYESGGVFVNVYHGRSSYELGCEIGLLPRKEPAAQDRSENKAEDAFSIWEIARMQSASGATERSFYQASTSTAVAELLPRLAELVRQHGRQALVGDPLFFRDLARAHTAWFEAYQQEGKLTQIRQDVATAWAAKDFRQVVELLDPVADELTPAEVRKLEYARARLRQ